MRAVFANKGDRVEVHLTPTDRRLLGEIPQFLEHAARSDDPGGRVLSRPLTPHDVDGIEDIVNAELEQGRAEDRDVLSRVALGATDISFDDAHSFLRAVNDARLVLAARAGILDEGAGWERRIDSDPTAATIAWLGHLQSELIDALLQPGVR